MTEKNTDDNKATSANKEASAAQDPANTPMPPSTESAAALGSTPPPPTTGTRTKSLPVPRGPRPSSRPGASVRPKGSEDEIFSIFNAAANKVPDDLPPAPMSRPPEPMSEKPKSQLGSRTEEREVTRSRSIPIDEDLFNLSVGLFSNQQQGPIVSPDMSALTGSSEKTAGKEGSKSAFDELLFTPAAAPVAPLDSLASLAPKAAQPEPAKPSAPKSNKGVLFGGILVGVALASGVFFAMQRSQPLQQPTASNQTPTTTDNGLDTRPGQKTATEEPRAVAPGDKPKDEPAAAPTDKPADTPGTTPAAATGTDKPAVATAGDKPGGPAKPGEPESTAKPAETTEPAPTATSTAQEPPKAQTLAEAMAAAAAAKAGGTSTAPTTTAAPPPPPPPPPPAGGGEFDKAAASAALSRGAAAASGCKAAGDPSGTARVSVTFASSGRATRAIVSGPPYAGTATGSCVAAAFRTLSVPAFSGDPVTVSKSVSFQ